MVSRLSFHGNTTTNFLLLLLLIKLRYCFLWKIWSLDFPHHLSVTTILVVKWSHKNFAEGYLTIPVTSNSHLFEFFYNRKLACCPKYCSAKILISGSQENSTTTLSLSRICSGFKTPKGEKHAMSLGFL